MTGYPSTLGVLAALATAGDHGLMAGDLSRLFAPRYHRRGNQQEVNQILSTLARNGRARRAAKMEPTEYYHNVPGWRWYITDAGRRYLDAGGKSEIALQRAAYYAQQQQAREAREARRQQATRFAALEFERARIGNPTWATRLRARDELIRKFRAEGLLTLDDIGRACDLSRERVRQISAGWKTRRY